MAIITTHDHDHQPISDGGDDYDGDEDEGDDDDGDEDENECDDDGEHNDRGACRCVEL